MNRKINANKFLFLFMLSSFIVSLLNAQEPLEEILTIQNPFNDYQFSSYINEGSGDVNGDGYNDFIVSKNDNNDFGLYYGEVYLYLGKPHLTSIPDYIHTGVDDDMFGFTASLAGDINGDGYNDVIISAVGAEPAGAGAVYIYLGGDPFDTEVDYIIYGYENAQVLYISFHYGFYLSAEADFNNDGYNDLVIGGEGPNMSFEGQVDVFLGGDPFDTESDFCLYGQNYFEHYGSFITGDLNGDGFDEFMAHHDENYEYILDIYAGGEDFPPDSYVATINMDSLEYSGHGIICNDINGDIYEDIVFSMLIQSDAYVKIIYGDPNYSFSNIDSVLNGMTGYQTNLFTSDINNDSVNDIIVSYECDYYPHYAGKTMIFYGGTLLNTIPDIIMTGIVNYEYFGQTGYNLGDVNGDGNTDILLGSSTYPIGSTINDYITIYTEENLVSINNFEPELLNYKLSNYPNPFNPTTTIDFSILYNSRVELSIYNIKGQKVKTLVHNEFNKGDHSIIWNGDDASGKQVSSGVYLYKLKVNDKAELVKKCILLK
ncbi:MAG: FG-GAP-like repeat-containing protein [Candidatus Cloacimonetes bacterium]|jgi:hypothetical protein|nr:FG-GAP-like repeat-containing protein [Candidatus Cloacimonadota bacterium]